MTVQLTTGYVIHIRVGSTTQDPYHLPALLRSDQIRRLPCSLQPVPEPRCLRVHLVLQALRLSLARTDGRALAGGPHGVGVEVDLVEGDKVVRRAHDEAIPERVADVREDVQPEADVRRDDVLRVGSARSA